MSKMPGDPWHGLWPCRDHGVIPVGFAGAVQQLALAAALLLSGDELVSMTIATMLLLTIFE